MFILTRTRTSTTPNLTTTSSTTIIRRTKADMVGVGVTPAGTATLTPALPLTLMAGIIIPRITSTRTTTP
jgi:hypothetical protein